MDVNAPAASMNNEDLSSAIAKGNVVPDGNEEIREHLSDVVDMIAKTARWVHPETFRALPVWCPWAARGRQLYDRSWTRKYSNTSKRTGIRIDKVEGNVTAKDALLRALDVANPEPKNWTVCHIWGYDDDAFASQGNVVRDPRFFTCVGNMLWLPTPLKGFTDALPEVKAILRACAYQLYGFACDHDDVKEQAARVRTGVLPPGYPSTWPSPTNQQLPSGVAPFTERVHFAVDAQKQKFRTLLADPSLLYFPRDQVREVLEFWRVEL